MTGLWQSPGEHSTRRDLHIPGDTGTMGQSQTSHGQVRGGAGWLLHVCQHHETGVSLGGVQGPLKEPQTL